MFWEPIHSDNGQSLRYDYSPTQETRVTRSKYQIEKTAFGSQYVIPGTERIVKPKQRVYRTEGDQLVIPGAERNSTAEYVARLAGKPITPRRAPIGMHGMGLFGSQSN